MSLRKTRNKFWHVAITEKFDFETKKAVAELGYASLSDLIRDSVRHRIRRNE